MLLKSVAAGALALGLFGAAFSLPASDAASNTVVESQVVETPEVARPTCCAKRAYCCSVKRSCCGKSALLQNVSE